MVPPPQASTAVPIATDRPRSRGLRRALAAAAAGAVAATGVATLGFASPAAADNVMPHDPIGSVDSVSSVAGGVEMVGWAADPDSKASNVTVVGFVDGRRTPANVVTSIARPKIAARRGTGPTPGFKIDIPVPRGAHTACLVVRNLGAGMNGVLDCVPTPLGTKLTQSERAAHSPQGAIRGARAVNGDLRVHGWATDPDYISRRQVVVLYVDGSPAQTLSTTRYPAPRPDGAGRHSSFTAVVPATKGTHVACIWVVNVGIGDNSFLGCRTLDTRGGPGTGPVPVPQLNKQVVAEAKKHIGQPYVWGAAGPKSFDCSGLVMFSYHKFGYQTPRVSEDQFTAARLIPESRAVPGDLVFYYNSVGDVYHVGIYTGPGMSVAAIDEAEGVNWQTIYSSDSVSFGSFTHT